MFIPRTLAELDRAPGSGALLRAALIAGTVAVALFLVLSANITLGVASLEEGQIAERDIRASSDATFISASQTEAVRDEAEAGVEPVAEQLMPPADNVGDQLRAYDLAARRVSVILGRRDAGELDAAGVAAQLAEDVPSVAATQRELVTAMPLARWDLVAAAGRSALEARLADNIREDELAAARREVRDLVTSELSAEERELAGDLAAAQVRANLAISPELTAQARQAARDAIDPVEVTVRAGEAIVREGDAITTEALEKLDELGLTQPRLEAGTIAANALLAVLLAAMLSAFLWRFEPEIWHRNRSILLFFLALIGSAVAIRVAADRTLWAFVVPTSASVLLIGILLRSGAGAALAAALAVIAGVVNSASLDLAAYVLAGGLVALLTIAHAERLNAFVRSGLWLTVTNIAVVTVFSLLDQRDAAAVVQLGAAGALNAMLSVALAVGSFAMLGNLFGIMTVFQMLELANPSNRLLRRLLLETPGTYHHSVMVGNLAERAAETIGADPLLARVAAYYHDVGKMKNPLAFIENQAGARNIHDDLTAETSARIIAGHIRDGIDLAYEHRLPVQVIGFIPQHHGTSVMSYFYGKALDEVRGQAEQVNRSAYRYP
ncbi:MAG: HDIG domain-containing metalloprotein, partial [Candidatus Limnocylindria bacterium]